MKKLAIMLTILLGAACSGGRGGGSTSGGGGGGGGAPTTPGFFLDESAAPVGATVTITGGPFGGGPGTVLIGVLAQIVSWSDTKVVIIIAPGSVTGSLDLTTAGAVGYSAPFTVTSGAVWYSAASGLDSNPGTKALPFRTIQRGVTAAATGDWVLIRGGTYDETVTTAAAGVTIAGYPGESAKNDHVGRCLNINHANVTVKDVEFEANYGSSDAIRTTNASGMKLRRLKIHEAGSTVTTTAGDGIDIEGGSNMLVEDCEIFECLSGSWAVQMDSHGIVAGNFTNLTIRRCAIYRNSGDCIQADPDRDAWTGLVVEGCDLWTGPLPTSRAGWTTGQIPGENAFDSKTPAASSLAQAFTFRDCTVHGFSSGWIGNQAAFNVKEDVVGTIERCTVYDNILAFRMRGPSATVVVKNCVIYDNVYATRYEDAIANLTYHNCTIVDSATAHFQNGGGGGLGTGFSARNILFEGSVPTEAAGDASNRGIATAAFAATFVASLSRDYHLLPFASVVDVGAALGTVTDDRDGVARPQGPAHDVGAFEYKP